MGDTRMKTFIPETPGGSFLADLESSTEEEAWEKLMNAASHMPYEDQQAFIRRGYTIVEIDE